MIEHVLEKLKGYRGRPLKIMEVCGTHTSAILKNGIHSLLPPQIRLVSGPGCPVCVTPAGYIDTLIGYARQKNFCVLSFGDMLRVPGSGGSLMTAVGAAYQMIYSPMDAVAYAEKNPHITYIVAAVGFETTTAAYAALMEELTVRGISNVKLLTALKTMPPALNYICTNQDDIDAFICPGHVAVVIGAKPFEPLARQFGRPFVVAGFGAQHIIAALYDILIQTQKKTGRMSNLYPGHVSYDGNVAAQRLIEKYFEPSDAVWRGIGRIGGSGLVLRKEFAQFDAGTDSICPEEDASLCRCSEVLMGRISPRDCALFGKACTPANPVGACMVSQEGACGIYYHMAGDQV